MNKYKEYSHLDLAKINNDILDKWTKESTFQKSVNKDNPSFTFYEGPPSANGLPW